jgi:WD40-like Beta Propeller Repeat
MGVRGRVVVFVAILTVAALGAAGYVLYVRHQQAAARAAAPDVSTTDLSSVQDLPHLVFRSTALGEEYGKVAIVPLSDPDGPRAFTPASCDRIYARPGTALCLTAQRGLVTTYRAELLGEDWKPTRNLPLSGLPSRARLSPDGSLTATTTFVYGDSYANPGQFSTRTLVTRADGTELGDLESYQLIVAGRRVAAADRNLWGVTFADDDTFYASAASGGKTWLVRGSLTQRRLVALRQDVECPSLSPDGTRIAFKRHGDLPHGQWRLAVYDLRSGTETVLAEKRSVDDQAEWLDNEHVLYGLPRSTAGTATSDIWMVPADGTGSPRLFVENGWSPSVVR